MHLKSSKVETITPEGLEHGWGIGVTTAGLTFNSTHQEYTPSADNLTRHLKQHDYIHSICNYKAYAPNSIWIHRFQKLCLFVESLVATFISTVLYTINSFP